MFYRRHIDHEDDQVITLDSGSIISEESEVLTSPPVNDDSIVDLLHVDSQQVIDMHRRGSTRDKLKGLFRTFSWRNKSRESITGNTDTGVDNKDEGAEKNEEKGENNDNQVNLEDDQYSFSDSPTRKSPTDLSIKDFGNLYDNTQPMLYLPKDDSPSARSQSVKADNKEILVNEISSPSSLNNLDESLNPPKTSDSVKSNGSRSPMRSLSRKFSIFSIRSRPITSSNKITNSLFDLSSCYSYFNDETLLTSWRLPEFSKSQIFMARNQEYDSKRDTENGNENDNKIYLFGTETTLHKSEVTSSSKFKNSLFQYEKIDNLLYYPFTRTLLRKYYIQKGNHISLVTDDKKQTRNDDVKLSIYDDMENYDSHYRMNRFERDGGSKISGLSIKSFHLQESLEQFELKNKKRQKKSHYLKISNPIMELNQQMNLLGVDKFIQMQTNNKHIEPYKKWKLWINVVNKYKKSHTKFNLYTIISNYTHLEKIKNNFDTLLDFYVQEKNQNLYILKDDELPIFHGKHKIKNHGEYVFVILYINARQVWSEIMELLITEQLNCNTLGYEIIGVCWRRYSYNDQSGYHLTLYVDERLKFDLKEVNLFLSDIRLIVKEDIRHCFKKCKTVFPGEKEVRVIDIL